MAFRDTWSDGAHSYLSYLRDRLTIASGLLADSGSLFVQIGEENVHLMRGILDEVFGADNYVSQITFQKTGGAGSFAGGTNVLASVGDCMLWYCKAIHRTKYSQLLDARD